jgi:hypothetical protein
MPNAADRALGLTNQAYFTFSHCDQPMTWKGSSASWSGPPDDGAQQNLTTYVCERCHAVAEVKLIEPC